MKKNIIYISLLIVSIAISSCNKDLDIWDSNTYDYSGSFYWELYNETMTTKLIEYDRDIELMIYNTEENIANKVWIEANDGVYGSDEIAPLKSEFTFDGNSKLFTSNNTDFDLLTNNIKALELPDTKPTAVDQDTIVESVVNFRDYVIEGKILPDAGTTISGNPVDSIYIKIKQLGADVKFTSYEIAEDLRADPNIPEFDWEYDSATHNNATDATYVISGQRKTGFAEDDH